CRDGCIRDLSSVHGSYRQVDEKAAAVKLVGDSMSALEPAPVLWLLDRPISNSGRLGQRLLDRAQKENWSWRVELTFNPDAQITASKRIAVSSDSHVLDRVERWFNLSSHLAEKELAGTWLIELS